MKLTKNNTYIVTMTCEMYYESRLKVQIQTFLKDFDKQQVIIFSDKDEQIYGYKPILNQRGKILYPDITGFKNVIRHLKEVLKGDKKYIVLLCDDTFLDFDFLNKKLEKINQPQCLHIGYPKTWLSNGYLFKDGYGQGGNVRVFNKKSIELIYDNMQYEQYDKILPKKYKGDFQFHNNEDVLVGYILEHFNVQFINLCDEPMVMTLMYSFPNPSNCKKFIFNNRQIGYHFISNDRRRLSKNFIDSYFKKLMHYAYNVKRQEKK